MKVGSGADLLKRGLAFKSASGLSAAFIHLCSGRITDRHHIRVLPGLKSARYHAQSVRVLVTGAI